MSRYVGWLDADNKIFGVTDGCGCYDDAGKCVCAECYHYGPENVNCANAGVTKGSKPVKWDSKQGRWILE